MYIVTFVSQTQGENFGKRIVNKAYETAQEASFMANFIGESYGSAPAIEKV